jgi:CRP-like cAMP-binding protein
MVHDGSSAEETIYRRATSCVMIDPILHILADSSVFQGLSERDLQDVREAATMRRYVAGELMVRQGDPALAFHMLICGHAKLVQVTPDGHQVLIRYARPGHSFGLRSALSGFEYSLSAEAINDCRALVWYGEVLAQLMERYSRIAFNGMRVMTLRNVEMQLRYQELLTEPVEQRVAQALLRLSNDMGQKTKEGILIDVPLSREDLAEYSGTTLYSVSRILRQWENAGVVRTGRERVLVRSQDSLLDIASATI